MGADFGDVPGRRILGSLHLLPAYLVIWHRFVLDHCITVHWISQASIRTSIDQDREPQTVRIFLQNVQNPKGINCSGWILSLWRKGENVVFFLNHYFIFSLVFILVGWHKDGSIWGTFKQYIGEEGRFKDSRNSVSLGGHCGSRSFPWWRGIPLWEPQITLVT